MELLPIRGPTATAFNSLKVLTLNASIAGLAKGAVAFVIVLGTIGTVLQDVKVSRLERRPALKAHETGAVVSTRQTAIGR